MAESLAPKQPSKTDRIRSALASNPTKSPAEIAKSLQSEGVDVGPQYVSTVKSKVKTEAVVEAIRENGSMSASEIAHTVSRRIQQEVEVKFVDTVGRRLAEKASKKAIKKASKKTASKQSPRTNRLNGFSEKTELPSNGGLDASTLQAAFDLVLVAGGEGACKLVKQAAALVKRIRESE